MSDESRAKLLLVDDYDPLRRQWQRVLERHAYDVDVAADLAEARRRLDDNGYDAVIVDMGLPDGRGTELVTDLEERPTTAIVAVSGAYEPDDLPALGGRVDARMSKAENDRMLLGHIEQAIATRRKRVEYAVYRMAEEYGLSPSERTVLMRYAREPDADDEALATALGCSVWTVKTHLRNIRHRTGTRSRRDLIRLLRRDRHDDT